MLVVIPEHFKKPTIALLFITMVTTTILTLGFVVYEELSRSILNYWLTNATLIVIILFTGNIVLWILFPEIVEFIKAIVPSRKDYSNHASELLANNRTLVIFIAVIFVVLLLWKVPMLQVENYTFNSTREAAELENMFRTTLTQIAGGFVLFAGAYFAWKRVAATERNIEVLEEGQITERFTRAIEHIGSGKTEIRLGGIYALERIAKDSGKDHWTIMEILTAYLRENSPREDDDETGVDDYLPIEIRAILEIIHWRNFTYEDDNKVLDFSGSKLQYANFEGTMLRNAYFVDSNVWMGKFSGANLKGSSYLFSNLNYANFSQSNLSETIFVNATLVNATLKGTVASDAQFAEADFTNAKCQMIDLKGTVLTDAKMDGTDFREADFRGAKGLSVNQFSDSKTLYHAKFDDELYEELKEKFPWLFIEPDD